MTKRTICVVTGSRADYGILHPILRAIKASAELDLRLVVTCMHLMREFGHTVDEIERDGFADFERLDISYREDSGRAMADSVGRAVAGFAELFSRNRPDVVVVLGDRGEMLAAAIAADYLNIAVAHIHGGELSGHVDGMVRHAITKLAHIHFPATQEARDRIVRMGEAPWRVFVTGAPALDRILKESLPTRAQLAKQYSVDPKEPLAVCIQHPVAAETTAAGRQIQVTLDALKRMGLQTVVVYPNADAGGREMISVIERYRGVDRFKIYPSLPHKDYLGLLKMASVLVGNSSSAIIEAPSFHLPVVNIGSRQSGRLRSANVIDVPHDPGSVAKALRKAVEDRRFRERVRRCRNPYGDGKASERIRKVLATIRLDERLFTKEEF